MERASYVGKMLWSRSRGFRQGTRWLGCWVSRSLGRRHKKGIPPRLVPSGRAAWRKWIYTDLKTQTVSERRQEKERGRSVPVEGNRNMSPQICCFGILIILSWGHLKNSRGRKGSLTALFHLKAGHKISPEKGALPLPENILITGDQEVMPKWICTNQPTKTIHLSLVFSFIFPSHCPTIYCPKPKLLCGHNPTIYHSLCKKVYKLLGRMSFSGLYFPFEDSQVHVKILNQIRMLFSCQSVLCQFNSQAQVQNIRGWREVLYPPTQLRMQHESGTKEETLIVLFFFFLINPHNHHMR